VRIASLLPSATEIVCALGLENDLVAITHECDYPPSVRAKPVVTASVLTPTSSSLDIDRHIRRLVHDGSSIYRLDADRLAALKPDLILTQELCDVCAVSYPIVQQAARRLEASTQLVSLEPQSLDDVFDNITLVGQLTDREEPARALVDRLSHRISMVREQLAEAPSRRVLCLEWLDPPFNCGHWTPQLVEIAGGQAVLGAPRRPASALTWDAVAAADPEVVVVMACGFSLGRSLKETEAIRARLTGREVHVVDGNAFFSRPGPRLVDSVEIMAGIVHPEAVTPPGPEVARRIA
jgi:iron complex transport system substrate-binding protein